MDIDLHFTATYAVARLAGMSKKQAHTVAYSSQYVDDAIHSGHLLFLNHASLELTTAAHRMLDYRNFKELANHHVWIPFHFLPANRYDKTLNIPENIQRLTCHPDSDILNDLLDIAICHKDESFGLHLMGSVAHTYVDTWSHQKFVGISHKINEVNDIMDFESNSDIEKNNHIKKYYKRSILIQIKDKILSYFLGQVAPLGHGPALGYPDQPYLKWKYINWCGETVERNNPEIFLDSLKGLYIFFCRFTEKIDPLSKNDEKALIDLLTNCNSSEESERYKQWQQEIADGKFSFGKEQCSYSVQGQESWLYKALNISNHEQFNSTEMNDIPYPDGFSQSDWLNLQIALAIHKSSVIYKILPKYNIIST